MQCGPYVDSRALRGMLTTPAAMLLHKSALRDITQINFESNISFFDANQRVEKRIVNMPSPDGAKRSGLSYAKANSTQSHSSSTQTDLTWPVTLG